MKLVLNKRSGAVVLSSDSEGLGAADVAGVDSNLTQPSGIHIKKEETNEYLNKHSQSTSISLYLKSYRRHLAYTNKNK